MRQDAERALADGDHRAASAAVRAALRQEPDDPANVFLMATVLSAQHRYHEAVRTLDHLADEVPDASLPVLGQTAEWLVLQGDWQSAEARFLRVIEQVPEAAIAHRQLAQLLLRQGRRAEAADPLRQLCRLGDVREAELLTLLTISQPLAGVADPETAEPIGALGEAWSLVAHKQWPGAIERLESNADQSAAQYGLLGSIHAIRQDTKALAQWALAIDNPEWHVAAELQLALGADRLAKQQFADAVKALEAEVRHDSSDSHAWQLLAEALRGEGDNAAYEKTNAEAVTLLRAQELAAKIQASSDDKASLVQEMSTATQSLQRPFESLAWQALHTIYRSDLSDDAKQQRINEINAQRLDLLRK